MYAKHIIGPTISLFIFSCQNKDGSGTQTEQMLQLSPPELPTDKAATVLDSEEPPEPKDRKLIKNGNISFETEDIAATTKFVKNYVNTHKGYISNEREDKVEGSFSKHLQIRLPNTAFNTFINQLNTHAGTFDRKEISVDDVTEEYVDVAARLRTKKEVEKQISNLLSRGKTVQEILNIEKELGEIRSEIESVEGRLKLMENQVSFSTLQLNFYKKNESKFSFLRSLGKAIGGGWDLLSSFIISIVHLWPFILITFGIVYFIKREWRK